MEGTCSKKASTAVKHQPWVIKRIRPENENFLRVDSPQPKVCDFPRPRNIPTTNSYRHHERLRQLQVQHDCSVVNLRRLFEYHRVLNVSHQLEEIVIGERRTSVHLMDGRWVGPLVVDAFHEVEKLFRRTIAWYILNLNFKCFRLVGGGIEVHVAPQQHAGVELARMVVGGDDERQVLVFQHVDASSMWCEVGNQAKGGEHRFLHELNVLGRRVVHLEPREQRSLGEEVRVEVEEGIVVADAIEVLHTTIVHRLPVLQNCFHQRHSVARVSLEITRLRPLLDRIRFGIWVFERRQILEFARKFFQQVERSVENFFRIVAVAFAMECDNVDGAFRRIFVAIPQHTPTQLMLLWILKQASRSTKFQSFV